MPSDKKDNRGFDDEQNPFISFRRYADQQFNALFRGMMDIPYMMSSMRQDFENGERELWKRFSEGYERSMNPERRQISRDCQEPADPESSRACKTLARTAEESNKNEMDRRPQSCWSVCHRPTRTCDNIDKEQHDQLSREALKQADEIGRLLQSCFGLEDDMNELGQARQTPSSPQHGDLAHWLHGSDYSPLSLERQRLLKEQNSKWRNAFEDLMLIERGKPPIHRKDSDDDQAVSAVKESWLQNVLGERGDWPNQRQKQYRDVTKADSQTELDMYEHFLGRQAPSAASLPKPQHEKDETPSKLPSQPSILSQVTNTHSRTTPDGKTVTTTTFTRKFTDGSEDTRKTITESFKDIPHSSPQPKKPSLEAAQEKMMDHGKDKSKTSNWFWSS